MAAALGLSEVTLGSNSYAMNMTVACKDVLHGAGYVACAGFETQVLAWIHLGPGVASRE
jgi:hypothetical protein